MRFAGFLSAVAALIFLAGCAEPVVFSEVFQLKPEQKIYTAYNIWYDDPDNISCLNIQQGRFIPIGTEIVPIKTRDFWGESITFKTLPDQREFTINFNSSYRLNTLRDYIAYTFTTKNLSEQLKEVPRNVVNRIMRGEVVPGMNQQQVLLTYGPPPEMRTPALTNESWIYYCSKSETFRVVFRGNIVRTIMNLNK